MPKLSKTSDQVLTLSEKDLKPFWNKQSAEIASCFALPTKTDLQDLDLTLSSGLLKDPVEKSWFSTKLNSLQCKSLPPIYLRFCTFSPVECMDLEVIASKLVRLSPTKEQRKIFKHWTDIARYVFNWTIDFIKSCVSWNPTWMEIKKYATRFLPEWTKDVPFQVKGIAIKEAHDAFWKAKGRPKFRTKKNPEQSCYIPKSAISKKGVYPTISGKGIKFNEPLPDDIKDSRLIWRDTKWWICIPSKVVIPRSNKQASGIVALDPGIRKFITFYSPTSFGMVGDGDFNQIYKLLLHLDDLYSIRAKLNNKRKKRSLTKAIRRLAARIKNLTSELHWKTARFLCENFAIILMPTFETKNMSAKNKRKIRTKTVRSMLGFAFYKFKQRLEWMARKMGVTVVRVSEAYTSKTHPETGEIFNVGSRKTIRLSSGIQVDRDISGARNILIKFLTNILAMGDLPTLKSV